MEYNLRIDLFDKLKACCVAGHEAGGGETGVCEAVVGDTG